MEHHFGKPLKQNPLLVLTSGYVGNWKSECVNCPSCPCSTKQAALTEKRMSSFKCTTTALYTDFFSKNTIVRHLFGYFYYAIILLFQIVDYQYLNDKTITLTEMSHLGHLKQSNKSINNDNCMPLMNALFWLVSRDILKSDYCIIKLIKLKIN